MPTASNQRLGSWPRPSWPGLPASSISTTSGGIAGIVVGILLSHLITWYASWPTSISAGSIAAAITVSASVGIGFGLYPANAAARLIPMEALRRE